MYKLKEAEVRKVFQDYCLEKVSFSRAVEILNEKVGPERADFDRLLKDEKYRMQLVINTSLTRTQVANRLGMNIRTFYRKVNKYNLDLSLLIEYKP